VCATLLAEADEALVVPSLVLSELDYWCHQRLSARAWLVFLEDFLEDFLEGAYRIEHPPLDDLRRCREIQTTYADLDVGVVVASIVALLERLSEDKVATLDHRHFSAIRPAHTDAHRREQVARLGRPTVIASAEGDGRPQRSPTSLTAWRTTVPTPTSARTGPDDLQSGRSSFSRSPARRARRPRARLGACLPDHGAPGLRDQP
jgi:uncharacterized protein